MSDLYRVLKRKTSSLQPGGSFWTESVLYCGYDRDEARRVYYEALPETGGGGGYGNPTSDVVAQLIADDGSDPNEWDDVETEVMFD